MDRPWIRGVVVLALSVALASAALAQSRQELVDGARLADRFQTIAAEFRELFAR